MRFYGYSIDDDARQSRKSAAENPLCEIFKALVFQTYAVSGAAEFEAQCIVYMTVERIGLRLTRDYGSRLQPLNQLPEKPLRLGRQVTFHIALGEACGGDVDLIGLRATKSYLLVDTTKHFFPMFNASNAKLGGSIWLWLRRRIVSLVRNGLERTTASIWLTALVDPMRELRQDDSHNVVIRKLSGRVPADSPEDEMLELLPGCDSEIDAVALIAHGGLFSQELFPLAYRSHIECLISDFTDAKRGQLTERASTLRVCESIPLRR